MRRQIRAALVLLALSLAGLWALCGCQPSEPAPVAPSSSVTFDVPADEGIYFGHPAPDGAVTLMVAHDAGPCAHRVVILCAVDGCDRATCDQSRCATCGERLR